MVVPASPKREQVLKLIEEKNKIERKIAEFGNILSCVGIFSKFLLNIYS